MSCKNSNKIFIIKGDDTSFMRDYLIKINIKSDAYDLTGCYAKFILGGISFDFDNLNDMVVNLTKDQTQMFNIGNLYGSFFIFSPSGERLTASTSIPFFVKDWVEGDVLLNEYSLDIDVQTKQGAVINITIDTPDNIKDIEKQIEQLSVSKADKSEIPDVSGFATKEYIDNSIGNIGFALDILNGEVI